MHPFDEGNVYKHKMFECSKKNSTKKNKDPTDFEMLCVDMSKQLRLDDDESSKNSDQCHSKRSGFSIKILVLPYIANKACNNMLHSVKFPNIRL